MNWDPLEHIMGKHAAADLWSLHPNTIARYCKQGRIRAKLIEGKWIIDKNQDSPAQPDSPFNWRANSASD